VSLSVWRRKIFISRRILRQLSTEGIYMENEQPKKLPYIEDASVSEVFADQVRITHFDGYSVRLELAVSRPHMAGPNQAASAIYPCARLVLTPLAAMTLQRQLSELLAVLEKQGRIKRLAPSSNKKQ
jgi:hypothetical protein